VTLEIRGAKVGSRWVSRPAALLLAVALAGIGGAWTASAEVVDSHVLRFEAVPSFINLNMTTSIEVEIGTSYGAGLDDYRVTVTSPDATTAVAWYNFSSVGTLAVAYGDPASGFATVVNRVGQYDMRLDYFDGANYVVAAYAQLVATDRLVVFTEAATASNEYTDLHNCPIAQEFQRGGEIIGRGYVKYASTGAFVNGTATPSAKGNITGTLFGLTKTLTWQNVYHFWRSAWFPAWNETLGAVQFTVTASDGRGNFGTGQSEAFGLTAWKVIPAVLKVVTTIQNETGVPTVLFERGDTVRVNARVTYEGHNAHNREFPGPLNATRGGVVAAALGYGPFNATSGQFEQNLATLAMTLDVSTQNWTASYGIPATAPLRGDLQVVVLANDGANPPNTGRQFTTFFGFQEPPEEPTTPPTQPAPGFDTMTVLLIAIVALVAGLGVGAAAFRRRGGKSPEAAKAEEGKPSESAEDEWEVKEGESK